VRPDKRGLREPNGVKSLTVGKHNGTNLREGEKGVMFGKGKKNKRGKASPEWKMCVNCGSNTTMKRAKSSEKTKEEDEQ